MSKKRRKVWTTPNYVKHFVIIAPAITGYISISAFATLLSIPIGIMSSAIGLKVV